MINTRAPDGANNDTIIQHKSPQMIQCQLLFSYLMKIQRYKISLYRHNVDKKKVTPHKTELSKCHNSRDRTTSYAIATELHLRTYSALPKGLFFSSDGKIVIVKRITRRTTPEKKRKSTSIPRRSISTGFSFTKLKDEMFSNVAMGKRCQSSEPSFGQSCH